MMRPTQAFWALLFMCTAADAHHSRAAFQLDQSTVLKAKITNVRWTNPHVFLDGEVVNGQGGKEQWVFEGHSISGLVRQGWSKETVKAGDEVQVVVNRHKDSSKHFGLIEYVVLADGSKHHSVGQTFQAAARTAVVNVIVMVEIFYLLNCRSLTRSMYSLGVFSNKWILAGNGHELAPR